jgi:predicted  nucleic acid-binding Zn-ribbon protein
MAKKKVTEEQVSSEIKKKKSAAPVIIERKQEETPDQIQEEITIAQKLLSLYYLQQIYSKIDNIRFERGELPNEVRDLEDAVEGLKTRIAKFNDEIENLQRKISDENNKITESQSLIKRYEEHREYDSLSKEIEYQTLEIQLSEKNKGKYTIAVEAKNEEIRESEEKSKELTEILNQKKGDLDSIIAETEREEAALLEQAEIYRAKIEPRLLTAFERIRKNARNGLGIVQIERDACGGCFSTIPPQRQLDIRLHKKIIVCEACGRIFIDKQLVEEHQSEQQNN